MHKRLVLVFSFALLASTCYAERFRRQDEAAADAAVADEETVTTEEKAAENTETKPEEERQYEEDGGGGDKIPATLQTGGMGLIEDFFHGKAMSTEQMATVAETLGGIVVYIFSYIFMAMVFVGYICGVLILMIFKIMFGGFMPAQPMQPMPSMPYGAAVQMTGYPGATGRYAVETEYHRDSRALAPFIKSHPGKVDYSTVDKSLFDRTVSFVNRGYATGLYLYDLVMTPDCQQYMMCKATASIGEERANNLRMKDLLRQVGVTIDNTVGKTGGRRDYARAVNKGALVGACEDRNMDCPALHPAFTKMNDLLNYFGMRRQ